jgi:hypothetical protein
VQEIGKLEPPKTLEVQKCRKLYQYLVSKNEITVLQWIPRHCDITGNEKADAMKKKDTLITETTNKEIYCQIHKTKDCGFDSMTITQKMAGRQSQIPWKDSIANTTAWPSSKDVVNFLLLTEHNCLAKYLYHKGLFSHLYCTL